MEGLTVAASASPARVSPIKILITKNWRRTQNRYRLFLCEDALERTADEGERNGEEVSPRKGDSRGMEGKF